MSSYTDATNNVVVKKLLEKIIEKMRPQPFQYLFNKNKSIILLITFILILIYFVMFSILISMTKNIYSKHEYFNEYLRRERNELNNVREKLKELQQVAKKNIDTDDIDHYRCWRLIYDLDYNYIFSHVLENNKHIQKSYNDTLSPLQYLLIFICFINMISLTTIYKEPIRLFLLSTLLTIIILFIHGEVFIADIPNVHYTCCISICVFVYSIYVLFKIIITSIDILKYETMKDLLINE